MPLANYAELLAAINDGFNAPGAAYYDRAGGTTAGIWCDLQSCAPDPGSRNPTALTDPSTATALSYGTDPEWSIPHAGSQHVLGSCAVPVSNGGFNSFLVIDRLSHQGGLDASVTTSQTTNLPTAALPSRATGGEGVRAAIQVFTTLGSTNTVFTVTYTNQSGTGSRTGTAGTVDTPGIGAFYQITLEGTDTGVRSVESVSLTPSTGSAGDFGIVLFKPIALVQHGVGRANADAINDIVGWQNTIDDDAILEALFITSPDAIPSEAGVRLSLGSSF